MRVLIVGLNDAPEPVGIGPFTHQTAVFLASRGCRVVQISGWPYYPDWRRQADASAWRYAREAPADGLTRIRCPLYIPRRPSALRRLLHHFSFALSAAPIVLWLSMRARPDAIVVIAPSLASAAAAWPAGRLGGALTWLHIQDLELDAATAAGFFGAGGVFATFLRRLESFLLRRFDAISAISSPMISRIAAKGIPHSRLVAFRNWSDDPHDAMRAGDAAATTPPDGRGYRAAWRLEGLTVALYSGTLGRKQGVDLLIATARLLEGRRDIVMAICGAGPERERIAAVAPPNLLLFPLQPRERLGELLALADMHLLPQSAAMADLVLPSKLGNMLASGRPTIAAAAADSGLAQEVDDAGLVVRPASATDFAAAILRLADDPDLRRRLGAAARRRAEKFWNKTAILEGFHRDLAASIAAFQEAKAQARSSASSHTPPDAAA